MNSIPEKNIKTGTVKVRVKGYKKSIKKIKKMKKELKQLRKITKEITELHKESIF